MADVVELNLGLFYFSNVPVTSVWLQVRKIDFLQFILKTLEKCVVSRSQTIQGKLQSGKNNGSLKVLRITGKSL